MSLSISTEWRYAKRHCMAVRTSTELIIIIFSHYSVSLDVDIMMQIQKFGCQREKVPPPRTGQIVDTSLKRDSRTSAKAVHQGHKLGAVNHSSIQNRVPRYPFVCPQTSLAGRLQHSCVHIQKQTKPFMSKIPGGCSPRPPFSRFARRAVVSRAPSLLYS
jgi:hypothetical protein